MPPRPDVSEERRLQIIEAAARVIIRKGYRKATMPDAAREAGLSIGGVYWYFKSKEEIVQAILDQCFQSDQEALTRAISAHAPALERLETLMADYIESFTQYGWMNLINMEFYSEAVHDPKVGAIITEYIDRYRQVLITLIEQGIQRGEFKPVDPLETANAFIAMEEGLALLSNVDSQRVRWRETFQAGMKMMIAGLLRQAQP